jgi:hypothetical protein
VWASLPDLPSNGWIGNHARRNTCQPEARTANERLQAVLDAYKLYELDPPPNSDTACSSGSHPQQSTRSPPVWPRNATRPMTIL